MFFSETGRRLGITDIPEELQDLKDWAEVGSSFVLSMASADLCFSLLGLRS